MTIQQGAVYWVIIEHPEDTVPGIPHPHVIIQFDVLNDNTTGTVVVCALTTNAKKFNFPGNVLLQMGEANLPRQSVVEASKISTIDRAQLGAYIGTLSEKRVEQILAGIRFVQRSFLDR